MLAEDAGLIGAALRAPQPGQRAEIVAAAREARRSRSRPAVDALHPVLGDRRATTSTSTSTTRSGGHAFYANPQLRSGGELYADITTGYGPECFAIQGTPKAGPYQLVDQLLLAGPDGLRHGPARRSQRFDGKGKLSFEDRPYVIMNDQAYVDLGKI